jgi:phosphoribosylformylglycinamidine synthase
MLILIDQQPVFSSFRLQQYVERIQLKYPEIINLQAQEVYWLQLYTQLNEKDLTVLKKIFPSTLLLDQSQISEHSFRSNIRNTLENLNVKNAEQSFLIAPRKGTISPWSSKATDILHVCGLDTIIRIERGVFYHFETADNQRSNIDLYDVGMQLCDRMIETVFLTFDQGIELFKEQPVKPLQQIPVLSEGLLALQNANQQLGLALSDVELDYLFSLYQSLQRNPTDAELMMFGVVNSEHCRHKIFNGTWVVDHQEQQYSLFEMIKNTYQAAPEGIILAYKDNAAILEGPIAKRFFADPELHSYSYQEENCHWVIKVETHNHPTAISPFPGAATGSGGELRDEGATGTGSWFKAGLTGYSVSHLFIPNDVQHWEVGFEKPSHIASAFEIMLSAPIGAASFNNEFGRPNLCGYFRSFSYQEDKQNGWGYHKPIMIAGGLGAIRPHHLSKKPLPVGSQIIVLGGPAMRIGLGGGSASSMAAEAGREDLDFASVQRGNPEMQRRCQEVISQCVGLGEKTPILSIHDVGAGGLSNAIPELVDACERGAKLELRTIPSAEADLSPMELWCNEAQERYVLAILEQDLPLFSSFCERERCLFEVIGEVTEEPHLLVTDGLFENKAVDLSLSALFGDPPKLRKECVHYSRKKDDPIYNNIDLKEAVTTVLRHPTVACKKFLITIGDRSVGGLTARDQMVGPWQVPVADCAVTTKDFIGYAGEAMSMGERAPVAILNPSASARLAVAEAITNIVASDIEKISDIKLSANWMAACGEPSQDMALFEAVKTVGMDLCPALGIAIPVGKDSLSMKTKWKDSEEKTVLSPLSLIISAFANVQDVRKTLTPQLQKISNASDLVFIDLGKGHQRLGGSIFLETLQQLGDSTPDLDAPETLSHFFSAIHQLKAQQLILAYHDRSEGGLLTTVAEMMFASRCGLSITLDELGENPFAILFNEELGAVLQIDSTQYENVCAVLHQHGLGHHIHRLGSIHFEHENLYINHQSCCIFQAKRAELEQTWSKSSYFMQQHRDNPQCAKEEFQAITAKQEGLRAKLSFDLASIEKILVAPAILKKKFRVAILREQGVNGHVEMAAAFNRAGFECIDVHMQDILTQQLSLTDFQGLAVCGGFSYGDVLGAGRGWAQTILHHPETLKTFKDFFERDNTFTLGICNGCQMLSQLKSIIPGASLWPEFIRNRSEQFEARLVMVKVLNSPSLFFNDMIDSELPVIVSHGEGQTKWSSPLQQQQLIQDQLVALHYCDDQGLATEQYPLNPNGSPLGQTAFTSTDGRALILMPHPERLFRSVQFSWHPQEWGEHSPWMKMFLNARKWLEN